MRVSLFLFLLSVVLGALGLFVLGGTAASMCIVAAFFLFLTDCIREAGRSARDNELATRMLTRRITGGIPGYIVGERNVARRRRRAERERHASS